MGVAQGRRVRQGACRTRCGIGAHAERQHGLGHPVFWGSLSDAKGQVHALAQQVDAAVGEQQFELHARVLALERGQQRYQHGAPKAGYGGDAQAPRQCRPAGAQHGAGGVAGLQHRFGPLRQPPAGLRQAQGPRGACQQGLTGLRFDAGDAAAHRGPRQAQLPRRLRKAARLHHAGEQLQRVGVQPWLPAGSAGAAPLNW